MSSIIQTPTEQIAEIHQRLNAARLKARQSTLVDRLALLKVFEQGLKKHQENFIQALQADFSKPRFEAIMSELFPIQEEIKILRHLLADWTAPQKVKGSAFFPGSQSWIRHEGKGQVLIIAPWNYPVALALVPLVGALVSGNTVLLKPSELTPQVSQALANFCADIFPHDLVQVVQGGVATSEALLKLPFDHIFFTGSTPVGRIVMKAAAEHLTPVTLELGGKSPVVVADDADLALAAERIVWGKTLNAGQTCVAPDFVYVHASKFDQLLLEIEKARQNLQPELLNQPQIITVKHADRLRTMRTEGLQSASADTESDSRRLELTVLPQPKDNSKVMREEIFGPLLPVLTYKNLDEVFLKLGQQERPLALYVFSKSRKTQELILNSTYSGGVCINDTLLHLANHHLPFGGTGPSGLGSYHGEASLRTFSHQRSVFRQGPLKSVQRMLNPPYSGFKLKLIEQILRWF